MSDMRANRSSLLRTARVWRPLWSIAAGTGLLFVTACNSSRPPENGSGENNPGIAGGSCAKPTQGCACTTEGASANCGQVDRVVGNYVTCSMGRTTCSNGVWGACIGDTIATKQIGVSSNIRPLNLATDAGACINDPCDPLCTEFVDTPGGFDAGEFSDTDAGLTPLPHLVTDSGVACTGLAISPPTSTVTVTSLSPIVTSPAAPLLTASYTPPGCYAGLASASWSVNPQDLAVISSGALTLVSGVAGPLNVAAYSSGFQATAVVNVVTNVLNTSQAPMGAAAQFMGTPTAADNIQILYPYPQTVFPRSIAAPLVQWNNEGVAASAVKVTIQYPTTGTPIYTVAGIIPESNPPQFQIDQNGWAYLDQTAAGQDALISIQRVVNGALLNPVTETVHFAPMPLRGSIFYTEYNVDAWTGQVKSMSPFGTSPAQVALGGSGCPVCHSVSANGSTLITSNWGANDTSIASVSSDGTATGIGNMWNTPNGFDTRGFAYSAITPDGLYGLQGTNWWGNTLDPSQKPPGTGSKPHNNGSGLTGTYYANTTLTAPAAFTRTDGAVDFAWGATSPGAGIAAATNYSVSWAGEVQPIFSETYTFETESSDGVTLTVNGQEIINHWQTQADTKWTGTIALTAGTKYQIVLQYENLSNTADVYLRWSSPSQPYQIIPETQLYPTNVPTAATGLLGTYYSNMDFTGTTFTRIDQGLPGINWNGNPPAAGIGGDDWTAEWTGQVNAPCADNYEWCVIGDDGIRLWIDGNLIDNGWVPQAPTWYCATQAETAGLHDVKLDYFQQGGGSYTGFWWASACNGNAAGSWVPGTSLVPTGDQGTGGYNTPFLNPGDYGTGFGYYVLQLSPLVNTDPTDVTGPNSWGLGTTAMMAPTFSPDGTQLVFVDGDTSGGASWRQGVSVFAFNEASKQFSNRRNIANGVAAGNVMRWPTVESDSRSVIYQTNPLNQDDLQYGGMLPSGYSTIEGELWSVDSLDPVNNPPVPLTVLNAGLGGTDSNLSYQPTVLPTSLGGYRWTVFTSDRQYGNTLNFPGTADPGADQLWVGALDDTTSAGADRSHPPFWLPNQLLSDNGGRIRNERGYWVLNACEPSLANLNPPMATMPMFNPMDEDIGSAGDPQFMGSAAPFTTYSLTGGGDDIWNAADAFNYAYVPVTGNFVFQARVTSLAEASAWSKAGVMLRSSLASNSPHVTALISAAGAAGVEWRSAVGGGSTWTQSAQVRFPYWVQISRTGTAVTGSISPDGTNWTAVTTQSPAIGASAYIGLAVTAQNNSTTSTGAFDHVGFASGTPAFAPTDQDIGSTGDPSIPGSLTQSNAYVVTGGGDDIWNASDAFHYDYVAVQGDFVFQARIVSLDEANSWSKSGVMVRDSLASNSAQAFMMINATGLSGLQWRSTTGNSSSWTQGPQEWFPYWVQISRSGQVVTGSISPDGVNWTLVDTETPTIGSSAYVGLAVTAHDNSTTATAVFDHVGFQSVTPPDPRPGSLCQDDNDCCGALTTPPTAACKVDVPVTNPVTRHCTLLASNSCVNLTGACTTDTDCCNFPNNRCFMNACTNALNSYIDAVFTRDYNVTCPTGTQVLWKFFDWESVTPGNSSIVFSAATATTAAALPTMLGAPTVVPFGTAMGPPITPLMPPYWDGNDVGAALSAAGQPPTDAFLRVFMDFKPSSDGTQTATLTAWRQQYDCVAAE
jgi:hypothetical protein